MPIYNGKVSVIQTKTGKVALVQDSDGAFELPKDTDKLYKTCTSLSKRLQLDLNVFTPEGTSKDHKLSVMARRGYETNPSTRPYFALLPSRGNTGTTKQVIKLA